MNPTTASQQRHNEQTRDAWERFSPHRQHVTKLLAGCVADPDSHQRLCVLGAGNCNDLDLTALLHVFAEITLVDLDRDAVVQGVERQRALATKPWPDGAIQIEAPCDITGIADSLAEIQPPLSMGIVDQLATQLTGGTHALAGRGTFDVVVSTGLLTQLFHAVAERFPTLTQENLRLLIAIRQSHLATLLRLTSPSGTSLFITDIVSSLTAPDLPTLAAEQLPARLNKLLTEHNFFTGANPRAIMADLLAQPELKARPHQITEHAPWLWQVLPQRCYLVWAVGVKFA